MINTLQRLILVDEGSRDQLSDIVEKLTIRQGQVLYSAWGDLRVFKVARF